MQNPRRLCHVHCIYIAILIDSRREEARYNIHVHVYTAILCIRGQIVSVRGSIRKFGKDKSSESSSSLLPSLRGMSGTA